MSPHLPTAAVLPAAGQGRRFGSEGNKIWEQIDGQSLLLRSARAFAEHPDIDTVVVVAAEGQTQRAAAELAGLAKPLIVAAGGASRAESVHNGVLAAPNGTRLVLVHDAARPRVSRDLISRVAQAAAEAGAAVPALPVADSIKRVESGRITSSVARTMQCDDGSGGALAAVQTPQGARRDWLLAAWDTCVRGRHEPTDEASLLELAGYAVMTVPGDEENIKITTRHDLAMAEELFGTSRLNPTRTGLGYDVHAFASRDACRPLVLGGVTIPHDRGLLGHSDADVVLHAICDALLGAAALGDIGQHFPNTDARWKDASSLLLLADVAVLLRRHRFEPVNIDCAVVAESPRLGPHVTAMREAISDTLRLDAGRVSIKATTSEGLGFAGRREGIAAWAIATIAAIP